MTPFGRARRRARESHGLSQEALAAKLGVSQVAVSYWERGVEYPHFEHLAQLISLLPELLPFVHDEEVELLRRLMRAERSAFGGRCACQGCGCGG